MQLRIKKVFSCPDWSNGRAMLLRKHQSARCFCSKWNLFLCHISRLLDITRSRPGPAQGLQVRRSPQKKWGIDHIFGRYAEITVAGSGKTGVRESRKAGGRGKATGRLSGWFSVQSSTML